MTVAVRIVVVDDDLDFRLIVRAIVTPEADSIQVVGEAGDGEEGLAVVRRERPDIVIADLIMPGLNGVELTKRIRNELPDTKIIIISSHTEDAYRLMASDSGADAFVNKRVIARSLLPAIHDVMRRRFSGGNGSLPPTEGGSSACAVLPC
jgi:Response regulator containing a CheY-like receiver domain and an HTH DNA-binding domain